MNWQIRKFTGPTSITSKEISGLWPRAIIFPQQRQQGIWMRIRCYNGNGSSHKGWRGTIWWKALQIRAHFTRKSFPKWPARLAVRFQGKHDQPSSLLPVESSAFKWAVTDISFCWLVNKYTMETDKVTTQRTTIWTIITDGEGGGGGVTRARWKDSQQKLVQQEEMSKKSWLLWSRDLLVKTIYWAEPTDLC